MSDDHERHASERCSEQREGCHQHDPLVVVGAAAVQKSCDDQDAEHKHGRKRNGHEYQRIQAAWWTAEFGGSDSCRSAHENHGDSEQKAQDAELHVNASTVRGNQSRLGDEEYDPSGEENGMHVNERGEWRRSEEGLQVVRPREASEDNKGGDASCGDVEEVLTPVG